MAKIKPVPVMPQNIVKSPKQSAAFDPFAKAKMPSAISTTKPTKKSVTGIRKNK